MKVRVKTGIEGKLKAIRSERGGEFNSNQLTLFCNEYAIKHYTTTPHTPQQNDVVKRMNQSVVEMARCMMKSKGVPTQILGEAVNTIIYVVNMSATKSLNGVTLYEACHGKNPSVEHLRVFGHRVHVKKAGPGLKRLSDRSMQMVFFRYEEGTKGYILYDHVEKKLHVRRDVIFEELSWDWSSNNSSSPNSL